MNSLEKKNLINNSNNNKNIILCYKFIFNTLYILFIIAIISYYFSGVLFLITNYNIFSTCNNSNLWTYVLISLITSFINTIITLKNYYNEDYNYIYIILITCNNIILSIWGSCEIWKNLCFDLLNNNLTNFAILSFIIQTLLSFLLLMFLSIYLCFIPYLNNKSNLK